MLIKFDSYVCNIVNVNRFFKSSENQISFEFIDVTKTIDFKFKSEDERNRAFEAIIESYDKEFKVCILD